MRAQLYDEEAALCFTGTADSGGVTNVATNRYLQVDHA